MNSKENIPALPDGVRGPADRGRLLFTKALRRDPGEVPAGARSEHLYYDPGYDPGVASIADTSPYQTSRSHKYIALAEPDVAVDTAPPPDHRLGGLTGVVETVPVPDTVDQGAIAEQMSQPGDTAGAYSDARGQWLRNFEQTPTVPEFPVSNS